MCVSGKSCGGGEAGGEKEKRAVCFFAKDEGEGT